MKSSNSFIRGSSALIALAVVLACGGGDEIAGNSYPLTSSVTLKGTNNDTNNIHFVINAEPYDPSNRVLPGETKDRLSASTYTWTNDADTKTFNVFAGRNGVNLDGPATVTLSGADRMRGHYIIATWDGTNLTARPYP